jgi:hypothetical protein
MRSSRGVFEYASSEESEDECPRIDEAYIALDFPSGLRDGSSFRHAAVELTLIARGLYRTMTKTARRLLEQDVRIAVLNCNMCVSFTIKHKAIPVWLCNVR